MGKKEERERALKIAKEFYRDIRAIEDTLEDLYKLGIQWNNDTLQVDGYVFTFDEFYTSQYDS